VAKEIAAHYNQADQVQITLKPNLELKKLVLLRRASADELATVSTLMIDAMSGHREENFLKRPNPPAKAAHEPAEAGAEFEHARQVNLERAANLPGFVADETVKRYSTHQPSPEVWKQVDAVESEVTFKGSEPRREHVRINGKPWTKSWFPGVTWSVDFGTELKPVFDPACPNSFEFEGRREMDGRELLAYRYSAPPESCFGYLADRCQTIHSGPHRSHLHRSGGGVDSVRRGSEWVFTRVWSVLFQGGDAMGLLKNR
jgi:hypothetical protein